MVSGASGLARSQEAQQWKWPNTIGTRERAWQKRQKTRRDMQHRTRRSASTIGGAAPETIIGPCCCGSRGSASLPCHTLRKRVEMRLAGSRRSASPTSRAGSDDPIFQPAKFSPENPLRELFAAQIHIVSNAAKQTIDA